MNSSTRITYVFVEAALELVPRKLLSGKDVISSARRRGVDPGRMILDISYHYRSMRRHLSDWYKRGRPDIIHTSLLVLSSSPLWRRGLVKAIIETRHGLIFIREMVRIARNYNRFIGLMEQVLVEGSAPPNSSEPLIYLVKRDLLECIDNESPDLVILLDEAGKREDLESLASRISRARKPFILVGGFQKGSFSERILSRGYKRVSIYSESLDTWAVICMINTHLEKFLGSI